VEERRGHERTVIGERVPPDFVVRRNDGVVNHEDGPWLVVHGPRRGVRGGLGLIHLDRKRAALLVRRRQAVHLVLGIVDPSPVVEPQPRLARRISVRHEGDRDVGKGLPNELHRVRLVDAGRQQRQGLRRRDRGRKGAGRCGRRGVDCRSARQDGKERKERDEEGSVWQHERPRHGPNLTPSGIPRRRTRTLPRLVRRGFLNGSRPHGPSTRAGGDGVAG
jgi:hypothetical protein